MKFGRDIFLGFLIVATCYLLSCDTKGSSNQDLQLSPINLEKYGIPAVIQVPQDATITEDPQSREKALVISSPQFNVRVDVYSPDSAETANSWLSNKIADEKLESDFSKLIVEDSLGFVLERKDEDLGASYHFRYIIQKENALIIFSEGVPQKNSFDLPSIMEMYKAVKQ